MPPTVAVIAKTMLKVTTSRGEDVTRMAAAAGVISRASTSRAPTIWMDSATLIPSSTMKPRARARTGTPRAVATSGSTLAKVNGRQMAASAASPRRRRRARTCS